MQSSSNQPRINPRSAQVREAINQRANTYVASEVENEYRRRLARWAADDTAPYPDRAAIVSDVRREVEILAGGLGVWAAVAPSDIFGLCEPWDWDWSP